MKIQQIKERVFCIRVRKAGLCFQVGLEMGNYYFTLGSANVDGQVNERMTKRVPTEAGIKHCVVFCLEKY